MIALSDVLQLPKLKPFIGVSAAFYQQYLSQFLPHNFQFSGIETSLYTPDRTSDFLVEIKPGTLSWTHQSYQDKLLAQQYRNNFDHLLSSTSKLSRSVRNIWLEYDWLTVKHQDLTSLSPSYFLGSSSIETNAYSLLYSLFDILPSSAVEKVICKSQLHGLSLTQAGFMSARQVPSARLVFTSNSLSSIESFLSSIGLPHLHNDCFRLFISRSAPPLLAVGLDISLSGSIRESYGIELYQEWMNRSSWSHMISNLLNLYGFCPKAAALDSSFISKEFFPSIYNQPFPQLSQAHYVLVNKVYVGPHHLKASFTCNSSCPSFKAYLGFLFPHLLRINNETVLSESFLHH